MNCQYWVSQAIKGLKCIMRLDLKISGYKRVARVFVSEMKNQRLIKKGESNWPQTYLLHKLENGGIYVKQQEKKRGDDDPRILFGQDKRQAFSLKQGFRNCATSAEEITPNAFLASIKIVMGFFFSSLYHSQSCGWQYRNGQIQEHHMRPVLESFKKLKA